LQYLHYAHSAQKLHPHLLTCSPANLLTRSPIDSLPQYAVS
jgi:hypothetical protein